MRRFVALAAAAVLLLLASQAVLAQYGPNGDLSVSNALPTAGETITVAGSGFAGSSPVQITLGQCVSSPELLATATTDGAGAFRQQIEVPASVSGDCTVTATGTDPAGSVRVLSAVLGVTAMGLPETSTSGNPRPAGSDIPVIVFAGVGIVLMTGVLLVATRRIRSVS